VTRAQRRAAIELVLAFCAIAAAVWSALQVRTVVNVAPIIDGQPATTSLAYDPPMIVLTLLMTTAAGVLLIIGAARWRRRPAVAETASA
jgi:hypothetical protein